jgi:hypothetical protein
MARSLTTCRLWYPGIAFISTVGEIEKPLTTVGAKFGAKKYPRKAFDDSKSPKKYPGKVFVDSLLTKTYPGKACGD